MVYIDTYLYNHGWCLLRRTNGLSLTDGLQRTLSNVDVLIGNTVLIASAPSVRRLLGGIFIGCRRFVGHFDLRCVKALGRPFLQFHFGGFVHLQFWPFIIRNLGQILILFGFNYTYLCFLRFGLRLFLRLFRYLAQTRLEGFRSLNDFASLWNRLLLYTYFLEVRK